jgi:ABC-2 type transport system permease protein
MAVIGLAIRPPEAYNTAAFVVVFPLSFIANAFIVTTNLPGPLKLAGEQNPASAVTQAAPELFGNTSAAMPVPDARPLQHPVLASLLWIALILAVFVPLGTWRYKKAVSR